MKVAVHCDGKNPGFSTRWRARLNTLGVEVKEVDCNSTDIVHDVEDCDAVMWHWFQFDPKAMLHAKQLTHSLEAAGKIVFPDSRTSWHFDDKVGQKYLLEAVGVPGVTSWVFYDSTSAYEWLKSATFPLVFKLRGGAGARNVQLAKSLAEARALVSKAFGRGFPREDRFALLKDRVLELKRNCSVTNISKLARGIARAFVPTDLERTFGREKGYVYFQEFLPGNDFDTRVIVIGNRAFAIRRFNRPGDFRASGSGLIDYDPNNIDLRCVKVSFEASKKLNVQSIAYDFVFDQDNNPKIVEISYGFVVAAYDSCPGYWTDSMEWLAGNFDPQAFMVDDLIKTLERRG